MKKLIIEVEGPAVAIVLEPGRRPRAHLTVNPSELIRQLPPELTEWLAQLEHLGVVDNDGDVHEDRPNLFLVRPPE